MNIPLLDASRFTSSSNPERRQYSKELLASLSTHGFVRLIGHGVPPEVIEEAFQWVWSIEKNLQHMGTDALFNEPRRASDFSDCLRARKAKLPISQARTLNGATAAWGKKRLQRFMAERWGLKSRRTFEIKLRLVAL